MYTKISQIMRLPYTFPKWNGYNDRLHITSNRLIKKWLEKNEDSKINSSTVKQIATYDQALLEHVLDKGIAFVYQGFEITLQRSTATSISMVAVNLQTGDHESKTLSQATMKYLVVDRFINHDLLDVLQSVYEKVK